MTLGYVVNSNQELQKPGTLIKYAQGLLLIQGDQMQALGECTFQNQIGHLVLDLV